MKRIAALIAVFLVAVGIAATQEPQPTFQDPLIDRFQGSWVLKGTIAGKETTHDVTNEWVLNHQFLRIHEVSREKNSKGEPAYEAMVFVGWDEATSQYVCIWLDIWGGFSKATVGYAPRTGDEIRFLFNDGKSDFHTTFIYDRKADLWEWRMDAEENGKLKPFARVKLSQPAAPSAGAAATQDSTAATARPSPGRQIAETMPAPPPPSWDHVFPGYSKIGPGITRPKAIYTPDPPYDKASKEAHAQGTAVFHVAVGTDGGVKDLQLIRSGNLPPALIRNAENTLRQWTFEPARKGGVAVPVQVYIEVNFKLN